MTASHPSPCRKCQSVTTRKSQWMHASSCTDPKRDELEMDIDTEEDDELRARGDELDILARLKKPIGRATIFLTTRLGRSTTMTCLTRARSASALRWRYATKASAPPSRQLDDVALVLLLAEDAVRAGLPVGLRPRLFLVRPQSYSVFTLLARRRCG
jgi:hypothetical protein